MRTIPGTITDPAVDALCEHSSVTYLGPLGNIEYGRCRFCGIDVELPVGFDVLSDDEG